VSSFGRQRLSCERCQQGLGFLQVRRVKPFGEPAVDGCQQRLGVGALHLGRCLPFGYYQSRAEGDVQGQGALGMLRRLWQGLQQLDPGGEVADRFQMGRALAGLFACSWQLAAV
jgi:hypothetical protein